MTKVDRSPAGPQLSDSERRRQARQGRLLIAFVAGIPATLVLLQLGWGVYERSREPAALPNAISTPAAAPLEVERVELPAARHIQGPLAYDQQPPLGGNHSPVWQNCGFYAEPVPPETGVHALEHGAVWLTYQQDLPAEQVDTLRETTASSRGFLLASPYPDLPAPVVASAWGVQLALDGAHDPRLEQFVREHRNGPQTPEPGAPCTGGIGEPDA